jgi:hypothetical protein
MVHNTQNHWGSGLCPLSGILKTRKHKLSETAHLPSSGERRKAPTLLAPLTGSNLNHLLQ